MLPNISLPLSVSVWSPYGENGVVKSCWDEKKVLRGTYPGSLGSFGSDFSSLILKAKAKAEQHDTQKIPESAGHLERAGQDVHASSCARRGHD